MFFHHSKFASFNKYSDLAFLALRLAVAASFLYHGLMKWGMWSTVPEGMTDTMLTIMRALSIIEPVAGLMLIVGLCTRCAALALAVVMVGAITTKVTGDTPTYGRMELDVMLLAANLVLLTTGGGKFSMNKGK